MAGSCSWTRWPQQRMEKYLGKGHHIVGNRLDSVVMSSAQCTGEESICFSVNMTFFLSFPCNSENSKSKPLRKADLTPRRWDSGRVIPHSLSHTDSWNPECERQQWVPGLPHQRRRTPGKWRPRYMESQGVTWINEPGLGPACFCLCNWIVHPSPLRA